MKNLLLVLGFLALTSGCAPKSPFSIDFPYDGGDSDSDSDADADTDVDAGEDSGNDSGSDTDTDTDTDTSVCDLNILEPFDDATLPTNWVIEDLGESGYTWAHSVIDNTTGGSGGYWWVDGSIPTFIFNEAIITGLYSQGACGTVVLTFNHDFYCAVSDQHGYVSIEVDDGGWQEVAHYIAAASTGLVDIDLTPFLNGNSFFKIRFQYTGHQDHYWKVDDFSLLGTL